MFFARLLAAVFMAALISSSASDTPKPKGKGVPATCPFEEQLNKLVAEAPIDNPAAASAAIETNSKKVFSSADTKKADALSKAQARACQEVFDSSYRKKLKAAKKTDAEVKEFLNAFYDASEKGMDAIEDKLKGDKKGKDKKKGDDEE